VTKELPQRHDLDLTVSFYVTNHRCDWFRSNRSGFWFEWNLSISNTRSWDRIIGSTMDLLLYFPVYFCLSVLNDQAMGKQSPRVSEITTKKKRLTKQMKMKSGKRLLTNEFFLDKLERCFPCTRYGSCNFFLIIVYDPLMLGCPCSLEADFFELSITRQLQISVL
jgi:hypothetical protein